MAVYPCEIVISTRTPGGAREGPQPSASPSAPLVLLERSRARDTRAGRNDIKAGGPTVTKVPLPQCASAERVLTQVLTAAAAGGRTVPVPLAPLPPPASLRSPPAPPPFAPPPRS